MENFDFFPPKADIETIFSLLLVSHMSLNNEEKLIINILKKKNFSNQEIICENSFPKQSIIFFQGVISLEYGDMKVEEIDKNVELMNQITGNLTRFIYRDNAHIYFYGPLNQMDNFLQIPLISKKMKREVKALYYVFLTTEENKKEMEDIMYEEIDKHANISDGSSLNVCFILDKRTYIEKD